jgi:serine/threonine protein kinase
VVIFVEACRAPLQTVHACGLAHCDIKPENIMLMDDGTVKLCDFGAAVAIDPTTGRVAAMPAEITSLELQIASAAADAEASPARPSMAAMTPYSLRKVTQARGRSLSPIARAPAKPSYCSSWRSGTLALPEM